MAFTRKWSDEQIRDACQRARTNREAARMLGMSGALPLVYRAMRAGIELPADRNRRER